jgi:hypothetical protein
LPRVAKLVVGVALIHVQKVLDNLEGAKEVQTVGIEILRRSN